MSGVQRVRVTYEGPGEQAPSKAGWWLNNWFAHKENIVSVEVLSGVEAEEGDALLPEVGEMKILLRPTRIGDRVRFWVASPNVSPWHLDHPDQYRVEVIEDPAPGTSLLLFKDGDVVGHRASDDSLRVRKDGAWWYLRPSFIRSYETDAQIAAQIAEGRAWLVDVSCPVGEAE